MSGVTIVSLEDIEDGELEYDKEEPLDLSPIVDQLRSLVATTHEGQRPSPDIMARIDNLANAVRSLKLDVSNNIELTPVNMTLKLIQREISTLVEVCQERKAPCAYRFEIERDNRQLMTSILAVPISE